MKTALLALTFVFMLLPFAGQAQKVEKKFADKLCECSKKNNGNLPATELIDLVQNCVDVAIAVNRQEINEAFEKQKEFEEIEFYIKHLMRETSKTCIEFRDQFVKVEFETRNNEDRSGMKHPVPAECMIAHQGTFTYTGPDANSNVYISRTGTVQYEGLVGTKEYVRSEIEWVDECTYIATFMETNDPDAKAFFKKGEKITVTITHVNEKGFSYFTMISGAKINGDMIKVSDEAYDPKK